MKKLLYSLFAFSTFSLFPMEIGTITSNVATSVIESKINKIINPITCSQQKFDVSCKQFEQLFNKTDNIDSAYLLHHANQWHTRHPRIWGILKTVVLNSRPCHIQNHDQKFLDEHETSIEQLEELDEHDLTLEQLKELENSEVSNTDANFPSLKELSAACVIKNVDQLINPKTLLCLMDTAKTRAQQNKAAAHKLGQAIIFPEIQTALTKKLSTYSLSKLDNLYQNIMRYNDKPEEKQVVADFFTKLKDKIISTIKINVAIFEARQNSSNDQLDELNATIDQITENIFNTTNKHEH